MPFSQQNPSSNISSTELDVAREFDKIISQQLLMPLFMPIVNTQSRTILGYESLIRGPASSPLHSPSSLFKTAHRLGRILELELLCREVSMRRFKHLGLEGKMFLNVTPSTLLEPDFREGMTLNLIKQIGFDPDRIVIEITEQFPIDDYALMKEATSHYRQMGFEVALDDLGAGYSGLRSWSELCPQYVKIDRHFIEGIDSAIIKQEFVRSIIEVARTIKCQVIAEGIERIEEYRLLNDLGIKLQQGYYFSRPTALPPRELSNQLFRFNNHTSNLATGNNQQNLGAIARMRPPINTACTLGEAVDIFRKHADIYSLAVVDNDEPIGLLGRTTCLELYLNPYGRELNERKTVTAYMDPNPLMLEELTGLETVSKRITQSSTNSSRADFIITSKGKYLGTGSVMDLLKLITEHQIRNARHANPLTMLPGSVPANEEITLRLQKKQSFSVCYFDLDHFKAFNDVYGYDQGDQIILCLSDCIKSGIDNQQDLVCHIGGDDFLVIFGSQDWEFRSRSIQAEFAKRCLNYYDEKDRKAGGIQAKDRHGNPCFMPICTISIGAAIPDPNRCTSHHDVARLSSDAKRLSKSESGNSLFINRRQGPDQDGINEDSDVEQQHTNS